MLRGELGYEGVIVTDSLAMQGVRDLYGDAEVAVRALLAGVDQLLMTPAMDDAYAAVLDAVRSGRITEASSTRRCAACCSLKYRRGIVASPYADPAAVSAVVGTPAHLAAADPVTDRTTTLVKNDAKALPLRAERQEGPRHRLRRRDDGDPRRGPHRQGRDGPDGPDRHVADRRRRSPPPSPRPPTRTSSSSRR